MSRTHEIVGQSLSNKFCEPSLIEADRHVDYTSGLGDQRRSYGSEKETGIDC